MGYHTVTIDAPNCSLTCKDKQLVCRTDQDRRSVPLEDVAAIVVTSFAASLHSSLLLEAARQGIGLILCENFRPASLVLPANRATDTHLTRAQFNLPKSARERLWQRTIHAKCHNQLRLAESINPSHPRLDLLQRKALGKHPDKEADTARLYWSIYSDAVTKDQPFRRERDGDGLNPLLNYGYAVLLSTVLQKLFAIGIDPTFGIGHVTREHCTPLAYDVMEPFRPLVDDQIAQYAETRTDESSLEVTTEYRRSITEVLIRKISYSGDEMSVSNAVESVCRSLRRAFAEGKTTLYQPWTPPNSKWAG